MKILGVVGQTGSGKDTIADHMVSEHGFVKLALADPIKRFGLEVFDFTEGQLWGPSEMRNAVDERYNICEIKSAGVVYGSGASKRAIRKVCDGGWAAAAEALLDKGPDWLRDILALPQPRTEAEYATEFQVLCDWFASFGHKYPSPSPRVMLQHLGTQYGRPRHGDDIWVDNLIETARRVLLGQSYDHKTGLDSSFMMDLTARPKGIVVSDMRFANELVAIKGVGGTLVRVHRDATDKAAAKTGIEGHASEAEQKAFKEDQFDATIMNNKTLEELKEFVDVIARTM